MISNSSSRSIRTWSVIGTFFAVATSSSSLSIRTNTSNGLSSQRVRCPPPRASLRGGERPARVRTLPRGRQTGRAHHVERFDLRAQSAIEVVHLELPLEIADGAQPLDDHTGTVLAGEVDHQGRESDHRHVVAPAQRLLDEADPLFQ